MSWNKHPAFENIEEALLTLNYRLGLRALNVTMGNEPTGQDRSLYDGFHDLLDPDTVKNLRQKGPQSRQEKRTFHTLLGHCLQYAALPYENELSMWMQGAAAEVDGDKIYLRDVHNWCQKRSDLRTRRIMEKETSSLSKFLRPFALSVWEVVLDLIEKEFQYRDYVAYCQDKKGIDYSTQFSNIREVLAATDDLYFYAMDEWARNSLGVPLGEANRFDCIYLVGLGEFDYLFPSSMPMVDHLGFFRLWQMDVDCIPSLHLHTIYSEKKGSQGITFPLWIPQEVHVVLNPQGGWIDLETLFHEMGHALSAVFTSPSLSPPEKDFNPSNTLTEAFAFLIQNMCFSPCFLHRHLGLKPKDIETIRHYKALKDMAFFRRYAAKFLAEYRMHAEKAMENGAIYASVLKKHTGFSYNPETQLFDLAPELYSLDYVNAWMAEVNLEKILSQNLGEEWMFNREAGDVMREWWKVGNSYELDEFFEREGIGTLSSSDLLNRWNARIAR
jgi:hypothetical protein